MNENIFWDRKINEKEAKNILKDEKNRKFIYLAATILSRTNDAKKVFSDYIGKVIFCKNWKRIKKRMRKNEWNDENIDFWDEIYKVVKRSLDPAALRSSEREEKVINPKTKKIGDSLKDIRKKAGLTQKRLASLTRLSQQTVSSLERGHLNFSFETLIKILDVLNCQIAIERKGEHPTDINEHGEYEVMDKSESADTSMYPWQMFPYTEKHIEKNIP